MDGNIRPYNKQDQEPPEEAPPIEPDELPKKSRGLLLTIVLLVVAVLIAIGVYLVFFTKEAVAPTPIEPEETASNAQASEPSAVTELADRLDFKQEPIDGNGLVMYSEATGRYLLVPAEKDLSYVATITAKNPEQPASVEEVRTNFYAFLRDAGYEDYEEPNQTIRTYDLDERALRLKKDDTLCRLYVSGGEDMASYVSQLCVDTNKLASTAETMEPYYVAFEKSADYSPDNGEYFLSINVPNREADLEGYEYAYGGIGGFEGGGAAVVFAREVGGEWVFVMGRQAMPGCEQYNSELFQKALSHEVCYDTDKQTETTVKEYYSL